MEHISKIGLYYIFISQCFFSHCRFDRRISAVIKKYKEEKVTRSEKLSNISGLGTYLRGGYFNNNNVLATFVHLNVSVIAAVVI